MHRTNNRRLLLLTIFDYSDHPVCQLYDSRTPVVGLAVNIVRQILRNGWQLISFQIPSTISTDAGVEDNYRLKYLIADYKIRIIDDDGVDWFIISQTSIKHSGFSKNVSITAGHIAQQLKFKNLGLLFNDTLGNNIGTAALLLETILKGTGWKAGNVELFYEKDNVTIKRRSMKALAKTGAFKLITSMCSLFLAKPVYHGDTKTIDILALNPFSKKLNNGLPDVTKADGVIELHYGNNLKTCTRVLKTLNLVTKLYAYGSYGDKTKGYCSIQECTHTEYWMTTLVLLRANKTYYFEVYDDSETKVIRNFTPDLAIPAFSVLKYSFIDKASQMYVYDSTQKKAYFVLEGTHGTKINCEYDKQSVDNIFAYILDFTYYKNIGLFTNLHLQLLARLQYEGALYETTIYNNSLQLSDAKTNLAELIGGGNNYVKLDVLYADSNNGYLRLKLNKLNYEDGCIYRTDYSVKEDKRFKWRCASKLDEAGLPLTSLAPAVMYVVHNTSPITWDKVFLKTMCLLLLEDDPTLTYEDRPDYLTFWDTYTDLKYSDYKNDRYYLFATDSTSKGLGVLLTTLTSALSALLSATTVVTTKHPVVFSNASSSNPPDVPQLALNEWGWWWQYFDDDSQPKLWFCYGLKGLTSWHKLIMSYTEPSTASNGDYYYNRKTKKFYHRLSGSWVYIDELGYSIGKPGIITDTVYSFGCKVWKLYAGVPLSYIYLTNGNLSAGRYYFKNGYDEYYMFTVLGNDVKLIEYNTSKGKLYFDGTIYLYKIRTGDICNKHPADSMSGVYWLSGYINPDTGVNVDNDQWMRSVSYIDTYPLSLFVVLPTAETKILWFNSKKRKLSLTITVTSKTTVKTPSLCKYFKLTTKQSSNPTITMKPVNPLAVLALDYLYLPLEFLERGLTRGLKSFVLRFAELSDTCFELYYYDLILAQKIYDLIELNIQNALDSMWRLGWWQKTDYVDGDLQKLYDDALLNLDEVGQPLANYTIDFVDLYSSDLTLLKYTGVLGIGDNIKWPDITIASAVHLVDPLIEVNKWAYIDKINKCYDNPNKTKITINTKLSTISQHTFTDVMSNIASVANTLSAKETSYGKKASSNGVSISGNDDIEVISDDGNQIVVIDKSGIKVNDGYIQFQLANDYILSSGLIHLGNNIVLDRINNIITLGDSDAKVTIAGKDLFKYIDTKISLLLQRILQLENKT